MKRIVAPIFLVVVAMTALAAGLYVLTTKPERVFLPNATHWNHVPVTVGWDRTTFVPWEDAIRGAMRIWNGRVGCEVLRETPFVPDVVIKSDDGTVCGGETYDAPGAPASTFFCAGGPVIVTRRLDELKLAGRIFLHELGHALYLDHDDEGAMRVQVQEPADGDPPEWLLPNEADVKALAARYCTK